MANLHGLENPEKSIQNVVDLWECETFFQKPIGTFSHGMKKRVGLSVATIHNPPFIILDEPYSGLDLSQNQNLSNFIASRKQRQQTILLSTHIVPYAAELCDRAFYIEQGSVAEIIEWKNWDKPTRIQKITSMVENKGRK